MDETVLLKYTRYDGVSVKEKAFRGRGFGGEGEQYMRNLFKANKVNLISFLNVHVVYRSFSNFRVSEVT